MIYTKCLENVKKELHNKLNIHALGGVSSMFVPWFDIMHTINKFTNQMTLNYEKYEQKQFFRNDLAIPHKKPSTFVGQRTGSDPVEWSAWI